MNVPSGLFEALRRLPGGEESLNQVFEHATFGIYVDHPTDGCIYASQPLLDQFDVSWEEFRGFGWAHSVLAEDADRLRERIRIYEEQLEPIHVTYRIRIEGEGLRWIHARVHPVLGEDGRHIGSIGITLDQTAEQEFQSRVARTQKMEAIGRLAARMAHDFNNLLTPMLFSVDAIAMAQTDEQVEASISDMKNALDQARQLTQQLLTMSRQRGARTPGCDLDKEVQKQAPLIRRALGEGMQVELSLAAEGLAVPMDSGTLDQILLNLSTNGADAMQGYGTLEIRTLRDGEWVCIEVEDRGEGMQPEVARRATEAFFTTKDPGRGTGLGLTTVQDLVSLAGGALGFDSTPGEGTCVRIRLPAMEAASTTLQPTAGLQPSTLEGEGLAVLVIEDQDALRQSLGYTLALRKFRVYLARSLMDAREQLRNIDDLGVLVSDVLLPDGESPALVAELHASHPELPVLYISGFAGENLERVVDDDPRTLFLEKPFGSSQFLDALTKLLSAAKIAPPPGAQG